ncbi:hypothetical protein [uncultured Oscillibacter sp.]|uniref:hypothetical protein n=1 Tax=uncultured Oscillibacter sp. TaxID=876091 RepID=UPI0025FE2C5A|nr:hypothetical protein [uncultured Oscillibacter sp.]
MNKRKPVYLALLWAGVALLACWLLLRGNPALTNPAEGALIGVGSGLFAMGLSNLLMLRWAEKDPKQMRLAEIESADERNVAIRRRAKALSGEVLQWVVLAAAWVSIALGGPLWVTLTAVGVFVGKSVLELVLMARYQRQM